PAPVRRGRPPLLRAPREWPLMPTIVWGSPEWLAAALGLLGVAAVFLFWSYGRSRAPRPVLLACVVLKATALTVLALCLIEPLLTGLRPRPGANAFALVADNSQSLVIR